MNDSKNSEGLFNRIAPIYGLFIIRQKKSWPLPDINSIPGKSD